MDEIYSPQSTNTKIKYKLFAWALGSRVERDISCAYLFNFQLGDGLYFNNTKRYSRRTGYAIIPHRDGMLYGFDYQKRLPKLLTVYITVNIFSRSETKDNTKHVKNRSSSILCCVFNKSYVFVKLSIPKKDQVLKHVFLIIHFNVLISYDKWYNKNTFYAVRHLFEFVFSIKVCP